MSIHAMPKRRHTPLDRSERERRLVRASDRWHRLLLRLYPPDFRDEMGEALVETYRDRCRAALGRGGLPALAGIWLQSLADSTRNGLGERMRPAVNWRRNGNWGRDAERAVRRLARAPLFAGSMVATLMVGLGAFAMVAAVVHKVVIAPLPYERPGDLYVVWRDLSAIVDLDRGNVAGTDITALASAGGVIQDVAGLDGAQQTLGRAGSGAGGDTPEEVPVLIASPNLFRLLGVRPMLGRDFTATEAGPGRPQLTVLGHDLWRGRFGGDSSVVGSDILLNGEPFEVIGVMGPDFRLLVPDGGGAPFTAQLYVTHDIDLATTNPGNGSYAGLIRASPGTAPEAVSAAVAAVGKMVDERDFNGRGLRLYPLELEADLLAPVRAPLLVLGIAGIVLVVVLGVNMATLLLVRAAEREREFAISRALGANRLALVRAILLEAGLLGLLGGALGALVAVWGVRALVSLAPIDLPRRDTIAVDWPLAAAVIAVGTLLGLLAGMLPAIWSTRAQLATLLRNAAVRGGGGGFSSLRRGMVVAQVALSLLLLSAGGLVVRSFDQLLRADPGFSPGGVLTLGIPIPANRYPEAAQARELHDRLHHGLAAIPGVESVGATTALPLSDGADQTTVQFPGAPGNTGDAERDSPLVDYIGTRPGFFETLRIQLVGGRTFETAREGTGREAVIDRTLADRFFPGGNAVGSSVLMAGDTLTVVGVVEHARMSDVHQDGRPQLYLRTDDYPTYSLDFVVRSTRPLPSLVPDVRRAVAEVDPQLAIADVQSMDDAVGDALRQPRLIAVLLSGFSIGALLLAAMGLYGVIAGSVSRRRHEMAVRLALGADHGGVLRLMLGEGARLVGVGLLIGVPGIYLTSQVIGSVLVGISPLDPVTLGSVALGLALVAAVACYVPARHVATIEPAGSLREG